MSQRTKTKSFTLIELLIVIAILGILIVASASVFVFFQKRSQLNNDTEKIINILRLAQSKTLACEDLSRYGVYFDANASPQQYILFKGDNFAGRDLNFDKTYNLSSEVEFYDIDLSGGSEVVFEKITGAANNPGSIPIRLIEDSAKTRTVYVEKSGYISLNPPASPSVNPLKDYRHIHFNYSRLIDVSSEKIVLDFEGIEIQEIIIPENLQAGQIFWEGEIDVAGDIQKIKIHTHRLNNPDTQFCIHRDARYNNKGLTVFISGDVSGDIANYTADGSAVSFSSIYVDSIEAQ